MRLTHWQAVSSALAPTLVVSGVFALVMRSEYWAIVAVCTAVGVVLAVQHARHVTRVDANGVSFNETKTKRRVDIPWTDVEAVDVRSSLGMRRVTFETRKSSYRARVPADGIGYRDPSFSTRVDQIREALRQSRGG
jgi:hypothetical protein